MENERESVAARYIETGQRDLKGRRLQRNVQQHNTDRDNIKSCDYFFAMTCSSFYSLFRLIYISQDMKDCFPPRNKNDLLAIRISPISLHLVSLLLKVYISACTVSLAWFITRLIVTPIRCSLACLSWVASSI